MSRQKFLLLVGLLFAGSTACSTINFTRPTLAPETLPSSTPESLPTSTLPPMPTLTSTPRPTATSTPRPTIEPTPTTSPYFVDRFEVGARRWEHFFAGQNYERADKVLFIDKPDGLLVQVDISDMYVYFAYPEFTYQDVSLEINFTNQGVNSQNIGLICRFSDEGWYEFSVGSDGMWYLYGYRTGEGFALLANGGSKDVNMGKEANRYGMTCKGDQISLYINGKEVKGSPVNIASFPIAEEGLVGFTVSSLAVYPVITLIQEFQVSEP